MQEKVKKFNNTKTVHTKIMPVPARLLDISSEIGELSKEYLKITKYGTKNFETTQEFIIEYGDVLYSLLSLADELNFSAEECLNKALEKYERRIKLNNNMGNINNKG